MTDYNFLRQNGKHPSRKPAAIFRIDGLNLTYTEIAKLLGVTVACAQTRMHTLRGASGAITLDRLRAIGA